MKIFFLLSLISVLFLSAYCQTTQSNIEIITKINITKYIAPEEVEIYQMPWPPFYRRVYTTVIPDGHIGVECTGWGIWMCVPFFDYFLNFFRGIAPQTIENTCKELITKNEEQLANGEYSGSITKKITINNPLSNERGLSFLIFQMIWEHDPKAPYNGNAEIIISKVNSLEM